MQLIKNEMIARRRELINKQKESGGCAAIKLKTDNLLYCYNPNRKTTRSNPNGEKFYITGIMVCQ